jgi:hypothetical protein
VCIATAATTATAKTSSKKRPQGTERQTSQYRGVCWEKSTNKWKVQITYDGKHRHLAYFEEEEKAARAYDRTARVHHGEKAQLNFPTKKEQAAEEAKQQRRIKCGEAGSKHRGVSWYKITKKWKAAIKYDGKQQHLGCFEDEEEAARAYDQAARAHYREKAQLNFPAEGESGPRKSSKYGGVSWDKSNSKWVARISYAGKRHHLGCFENAEEAAKAYDRAAKVHKGKRAQLNFAAKQRNSGKE